MPRTDLKISHIDSLGSIGNIGTPNMEKPATDSLRGLFSLTSSPEAMLADLLIAAILLILLDGDNLGDRDPITERNYIGLCCFKYNIINVPVKRFHMTFRRPK